MSLETDRYFPENSIERNRTLRSHRGFESEERLKPPIRTSGLWRAAARDDDEADLPRTYANRDVAGSTPAGPAIESHRLLVRIARKAISAPNWYPSNVSESPNCTLQYPNLRRARNRPVPVDLRAVSHGVKVQKQRIKRTWVR